MYGFKSSFFFSITGTFLIMPLNLSWPSIFSYSITWPWPAGTAGTFLSSNLPFSSVWALISGLFLIHTFMLERLTILMARSGPPEGASSEDCAISPDMSPQPEICSGKGTSLRADAGISETDPSVKVPSPIVIELPL